MRLTAEERRSISKVDSWIASGGGQAPHSDDVQPRQAQAGPGVSLGPGFSTPTARRVPSSSLISVAKPASRGVPLGSTTPTRAMLSQQNRSAGAKRMRAQMNTPASTPSAFSAFGDRKTSQDKENVTANGAATAGSIQANEDVQSEVHVEAQRALTVFLDGLSSFWHNANADALDLTKNAICGAVSNGTVALKPSRWFRGLLIFCLGGISLTFDRSLGDSESFEPVAFDSHHPCVRIVCCYQHPSLSAVRRAQ